ncbi:olfactory receptor 8K1-like, partial [Vombatus ursinus]|uniref:olfactory receptor 8K1-like n=1 Tax=Vombatus ursinus TaxID=29139 RepID=UPI000FFD41AA
MAIVVGNLGLIILTSVDSHLKTPMYFFLKHLAFVDLGFSTAIGPKMLVGFTEAKNIISNNGCVAQLIFFGIFTSSEVFILSAMAYDRYVAICKPLHYTVIMSDRVQRQIHRATQLRDYISWMAEMINLNETPGGQLTEFILMGITNSPEMQGPHFVVLLLNYMVIVVGNLGLIILIIVDSHLKTPMYFFLRHLTFVDLGYSTSIGPEMIVGFIEKKNIISYNGCAIQQILFVILMASEIFILSAMAYDHYVAICKPLYYMAIMSDR